MPLRGNVARSSSGGLEWSRLRALAGIRGVRWKGSLVLCAVAAGSLAVNTFLAVCVDGDVPLALRAFGQDPALASGPFRITVTDYAVSSGYSHSRALGRHG